MVTSNTLDFHRAMIFLFLLEYFKGLEVSQTFSQHKVEDLIHQDLAPVFIDETLLMSKSKANVPQLFQQFHDIVRESNLKIAFGKSPFMTLTVN